MVEVMSVAVNVMLFIMSVMSPRTVVKLCNLGVFALWVSLVSCIVQIHARLSRISS